MVGARGEKLYNAMMGCFPFRSRVKYMVAYSVNENSIHLDSTIVVVVDDDGDDGDDDDVEERDEGRDSKGYEVVEVAVGKGEEGEGGVTRMEGDFSNSL